MKNNNKKENKICFILHTISSVLFTLSGLIRIFNTGFTEWQGITNIALGITFGSLAYIYYKKYKEKE